MPVTLRTHDTLRHLPNRELVDGIRLLAEEILAGGHPLDQAASAGSLWQYVESLAARCEPGKPVEVSRG